MRDIEFRGKSKESGDWMFGFLIYPVNREDEEPSIQQIKGQYNGKQFIVRGFCEVTPETLGEYTGLLDRNKAKIFEGDIVTTDIGTIGDVQSSHGMFGIEWVRAKAEKHMVGSWGQLHNLRRMDDGFNEKVEVIGNIHDNPELLEAKDETNT